MFDSSNNDNNSNTPIQLGIWNSGCWLKQLLTYIYIYIFLYIHVYIYIYTYIHTTGVIIYIYIYITVAGWVLPLSREVPKVFDSGFLVVWILRVRVGGHALSLLLASAQERLLSDPHTHAYAHRAHTHLYIYIYIHTQHICCYTLYYICDRLCAKRVGSPFPWDPNHITSNSITSNVND